MKISIYCIYFFGILRDIFHFVGKIKDLLHIYID